MSLADVQSLVDDLVRDKDQVIASVQRDAAIAAALERYSADSPRLVVEDLTAPGGQYLPLPALWLDGQSEIRGVEYPIGEVPPAEIDVGALRVILTPSTSSLLFTYSPSAGELVRVAYTAAHVLDGATDTIPNRHRRLVAALAAADLCGQLASYYASEGAPTIAADVADHQGKSERYRARARDLRAEYAQAIGTQGDRAKPASVDVALPPRDSLGGRPLFHPPRGWPR